MLWAAPVVVARVPVVPVVTVPPLMVKAPPKVFRPERVCVPVPILVKATVPDPLWMMPAKLVLSACFRPWSRVMLPAVELVTVPPEPETSDNEPMVSLKACKSRVALEATVTAEFTPNAPEVGDAPPTVATLAVNAPASLLIVVAPE